MMLSVIVTLALLGMVTWGVTTALPMPPKFAQVIQVIALIGGVVYALHAFGILPQ